MASLGGKELKSAAVLGYSLVVLSSSVPSSGPVDTSPFSKSPFSLSPVASGFSTMVSRITEVLTMDDKGISASCSDSGERGTFLLVEEKTRRNESVGLVALVCLCA